MICQGYRLFFFTFFTFLLFSCEKDAGTKLESVQELQRQLDSLQASYAPDKRVAHLHLSIKQQPGSECFSLYGKTNLPAAIAAIREWRSGYEGCLQDSLIRLPSAALGGDTLGIVKVSVANLRSQPGHSSELATQALLGQPLKVFDRQGDWYLVQTPDYYLAWLEAGAFCRLDYAGMQAYYQSQLAFVAAPLTKVLSQPSQGSQIVRDLTMGNLISRLDEQQGTFQHIQLPDGAKGWVETTELLNFHDWLRASEQLQLGAYAKDFYGIPYLWGGTSAKGLDCSGFTKMAYWRNGFVIPRDASQQVHAGAEVLISQHLEDASAGDLLFFGSLRADGSQRISHVGLYLGGGRFVHSGADNGFITEESLLPDSPDFAPHRRESLLRIKRLSSNSKDVRKAAEALFFWQ